MDTTPCKMFVFDSRIFFFLFVGLLYYGNLRRNNIDARIIIAVFSCDSRDGNDGLAVYLELRTILDYTELSKYFSVVSNLIFARGCHDLIDTI